MHYCGICLRCKLISEGFFCHWPPGHVSEVYKRKSIEVIDDMEMVIKFGFFFPSLGETRWEFKRKQQKPKCQVTGIFAS